MLRASINAGLEYEVWRHKIGIGLLYTARVWEYKTLHNITGSVNFHPDPLVYRHGQLFGDRQPRRRRGAGAEPEPQLDQFLPCHGHRSRRSTRRSSSPSSRASMNVTLGMGSPDRQSAATVSRPMCTTSDRTVNPTRKRANSRPCSGRVFSYARTPENSAEPGIKTLGRSAKKTACGEQTHPPFPIF